MIRFLLLIVLMTISMAGQTQNLSGVATYKSASQVSAEFNGPRGSKMTDAQKEEMRKTLQKALQREYELTFTLKESNWKQLESLGGAPAAPAAGFRFEIRASDENLYKNIQTGIYLEEQDLMGKAFLVRDSLERFDWQLVDEYKQIGNYTCQKATYQTTRERMTVQMGDGENEATTTTDTVTYTAWYTSQIPVQHGPSEYWGLPGLIMEITNGRTTLICSKLVLNPTDGVEIEVPTKGKEVSQEEYDEISREKMKEMMEQYRGKGGGRQIMIQGGE
jgi:GLPGLI family protein